MIQISEKKILLSSKTTLELGGPAQFYAEAHTSDDVIAASRFARQHQVELRVLGGGSNLVVSDEGVPGLVLALKSRGIVARQDGAKPRGVLVTAQAGEPWDAFVEYTVKQNWSGLECLSGIPGLVGASPIQNIGAYGADVSEVIHSVHVFDTKTESFHQFSNGECGFSYRESFFKKNAGRYMVLDVCFSLQAEGAPQLRYAELQNQLADIKNPSIQDVRRAVLDLRRRKSMVIDPLDENRRSVGSFFLNPIVSQQDAAGVVATAMNDGMVTTEDQVPRYPAANQRVKLSAAWLIEKSGISKGLRMGSVGVSSKHSLCLVHHGGGTTVELLALARFIQKKVEEKFKICLQQEPVLWSL